VTATDTSNNKTFNLTLNGNVTAQQICNLTLTAYAKNQTATLTFNVTGQDGATGFCNITVPKTAIPNGLKPEVYVDGQLIEAQGYCEDRENYYVWWTVHFSSHTVVFQFTATPSTTGMFEWWALVLPLSAAAAVGLTAVYTRRRKRN
jgi:hypothetical protein